MYKFLSRSKQPLLVKLDISRLTPRQRKVSVLANALSGTVGSVLAEAVLFPVDTIKLKAQTPRGEWKMRIFQESNEQNRTTN